MRRDWGRLGQQALLGFRPAGRTSAFVGIEQWWIGPLHLQVEGLQAALQNQQRLEASEDAVRQVDQASPSAEVSRFLASFSGDQYQPDWLVFIHAIASGQQLQSGETHYERHSIESLGVVDHVIRLPLTGSFDQLHRFILELTSRLPMLSVDRIQVSPSRRQTGSLDVQLRLSVLAPDRGQDTAGSTSGSAGINVGRTAFAMESP